MSIFNWGHKREQARTERLQELDRKNRRALEDLAKEQARGYVIGWRKHFERLGRLIAAESTSHDADFRAYMIGKAISGCESYQNDYAVGNESLNGILEDLKRRLTSRIMEIAWECGCGSSDVETAISFLARTGRLGDVIDFLDEMEKLLSPAGERRFQ